MSFDAVREKVSASFKTAFAAAHPTVPIKFDNQTFTQPRNGPWVEFDVLPGDSVRSEISSAKRFYHYGVINVIVLVPEGTGTKTMWEIADTVFNTLADREWSDVSGKITTYGARKQSRGTSNGFRICTVQCEYRQHGQVVR